MAVRWHLSIHPDVWIDIDKALSYYAEIDRDLVRRWRKEFNDGVKLAQHYPYIGPEGVAESRRLKLPSFPYMVYYLAETGVIEVVAVIHVKQDPARTTKMITDRSRA